ncbi:MAG: hypothetical protein EOO46_18405 [Flavobacterium sp.]|nr:MAG: hypothetical protein EOO46_18405 [Flavobacterium sp.]
MTEEEKLYAADIRQRYLVDTLADAADYFAASVTEAMSGAVAKKGYFGLGNTNNGKSIIVETVSSVFGDYVGNFKSS